MAGATGGERGNDERRREGDLRFGGNSLRGSSGADDDRILTGPRKAVII